MSLSYDLAFEDQIRECYGRVVYTHKTHERMADRCASGLRFFKWAQITLSALTSAGAVAVVVQERDSIEIATAALSFLTLFVAAYLKNFDPGATAQKHRDAAAKLWNIRECYLSLLTDLPKLPHNEAVERRDELQSMLAAIYVGSPQTDGKAYMEAQDRLKNMEDMTFSDEEIDCFLPLSLKRAGGRPRSVAKS
ncbi:SLATT domain-containing protein [Salipiger manganoxidans]|uniref:SLATT domain-containing protein n=1 Tax=Salipiger marinus TaxID=555512 RepID=UPI001E637692|nr:SLATT domain-containing protein [Salipiger manganoxidans]MCD1621099.1 SLATT domain-containing protein [Salipiger manganoxidans]